MRYLPLFACCVVVSLGAVVDNIKTAQEDEEFNQVLEREKRARNQRTVDPDVYLEKFGYLGHLRPGVQRDPASRENAIKNFQRMAGLRVTGTLDQATRTKMLSPRCGMPDMVPEESDFRPPDGVAFDPNSEGPQSFYVPGYKWSKKDLTWKAINYSPDMNFASQRRAFYDAFRHWSDASALSFAETSGEPDIEIKFAHGEHGDGAANRFDGQGMVLAHAFYPESGDTHFDEAEDWTENTHTGTNLMIVAAHEFGHALGLGHSNVPQALMAPIYQGYDPNFKLHDDDIQAIQSLYGPKERPRPPTPRPTRRPRPTQPSVPATKKPGSKPDTCDTKFDAIMTAHDGRIYVFRERWMWRLTYWNVEEEFPRLARKYFEAPPISPGAAVYSWRTRYTYFFKANRIWKYYGFRKIERKTVRNRNYPKSIQAAIIGRDGKITLMSGSKTYKFDESRLDIEPGRPRPIRDVFPGIPSNTEAAIRLNDGYMYFFKGDNYRKYDEIDRRVLPGYPRSKKEPWMGPKCHPRHQYEPK